MFDEASAVNTAVGMLVRAGFKGADTQAIHADLEARFDVCSTVGLGMDAFLEPIHQLVKAGPNEGQLLGRINDTDAIRRVIAESTGELRQKFIRR